MNQAERITLSSFRSEIRSILSLIPPESPSFSEDARDALSELFFEMHRKGALPEMPRFAVVTDPEHRALFIEWDGQSRQTLEACLGNP